jgi:hypothetical protein
MKMLRLLNNLNDEWLNGGTTFKCTAATIESPLSISPARMASAARTAAAMINLHAVLLHLRITLMPTKPGSRDCVLKSMSLFAHAPRIPTFRASSL